MKRISDKQLKDSLRLILAVFLLLITGCTTVWNNSLPDVSNRSKEEVLRVWGTPTKILTDKGKIKYDAEEMWIYKIKDDVSLVEERLYFRGGILIKYESVTRDPL